MTSGGLVVAIVNSIWQGLALVGIVALVLRYARRCNAATTCAVWSATLFAVALLPAVDLALQRTITAENVAPVAAPALTAHGAGVTPVVASNRQFIAVATAARTIARGLSMGAERVSVPLLVLWTLISSLLLTLLARNGYALSRLKRGAVPLDLPAIRAIAGRPRGRPGLRICSSQRVAIPCAAGFLHPMVLLPASLLETLPEDDIARIVLHEVGHLERYDDWSNVLERVLSAIFFFQPALVIAARRIDFERELACDDRVLAAVGEPVRYAECLTRIVERQLRRRAPAAVPGFLVGRSQVTARIARLVDQRRNGTVGVARPVAAALLVLTFAATGIANVQVPFVARAVSMPVPPRARPARVALTRAPLARPPSRTRHAHALPRPVQRTAVAFVQRPIESAARSSTPVSKAATAGNAARAARARVRHIEKPDMTVAFVQEHPMQRGPSAPGADDQATASDVASSETPAPDAPPANSDLSDALVAAGYHASDAQLMELQDTGLNAGLVRAIAASGIHLPNLHALLGMCQHGIDRAYVHFAVKRFGTAITWEDIAALHDEGIGASYLDALADAGYDHLTVRDAISLEQSGVSAEYIAALAAQGYEHLTPSELIDLHNGGVDAEFLQELAQHGYHGLSTAEVVRLHDEGLGS